MTVSGEVTALYTRRGAGSYFGEPVSMLEHGLQAAYFARAEGAPASLVIAALLHDIGHLLDDVPADIHDWHADARHEDVGRAWLAQRFGPEVSEPVALHVAAKRYLCATDPSYARRLSPASVLTLRLQGGPMSAAEVAAFEAQSHFREGVRLRHWDDQGKLAGFNAPGLHEYLEMIDALARPQAG
ncbi:MAG: HD domain-containing protein [Proteobacteria bacterium]|nr:HD domain-containing protein [Pseudomonadota bacterium]